MFLTLILALNDFVFNSINYLQIMGCTTGTVCTPAYGNIFMAQFQKQNTITLHKKNQLSTYNILMIYMFMIWTGTKQELLVF